MPIADERLIEIATQIENEVNSGRYIDLQKISELSQRLRRFSSKSAELQSTLDRIDQNTQKSVEKISRQFYWLLVILAVITVLLALFYLFQILRNSIRLRQLEHDIQKLEKERELESQSNLSDVTPEAAEEEELFFLSSYTQNPILSRMFHHTLIKCCKALGHHFSIIGICNGFTMRWLEAALQKKEAILNKRLNKILILNSYLDSGTPLSELEKDPRWQKDLWEIKAFYESILLYQNPERYTDLFAKPLSQQNIEEISLIAASDETKALGGIKITDVQSGIYDAKTMTELLSKIENIVQNSAYSSPIGFRLCIGGFKTRKRRMRLQYYTIPILNVGDLWMLLLIHLMKVIALRLLKKFLAYQLTFTLKLFVM